MKPHGERIATLEAEMIAVKDTLEQQGIALAGIAQKQQEILLALTKNKGMWGGVVMTVGALATLFNMLKDQLVTLVTKLFQ
jgi:hypothetical protein